MHTVYVALTGMFVALDQHHAPVRSHGAEIALGTCRSATTSVRVILLVTHHTATARPGWPSLLGWWTAWIDPEGFFSSLGVGDERLRLSHEGGCSSGGDRPADIGGGMALWKSPPILRERELAWVYTSYNGPRRG